MNARQHPDGFGESPRVRFPPPLVFLGSVAIAMWLRRSWPLRIIPVQASAPLEAAGWSLVCMGSLLCLAAAGLFLGARTPLMPNACARAFVVRGPYRFTRNPMYLGMVMAQTGASLVLDTWWLLAVLPAAVWFMNTYVIRREEAHLAARFGEDYARYCRGTRRWL